MNEALFKALDQPVPTDETATGLDYCLHLALVQAGEDGFNASMPISIAWAVPIILCFHPEFEW